MRPGECLVGAGCERPIQPAPRSVLAPRLPLRAPLRSIVLLQRPLISPLRSTPFSARSAPFSVPLAMSKNICHALYSNKIKSQVPQQDGTGDRCSKHNNETTA